MDEDNEYGNFDVDSTVLARLPWLETLLDPTTPCIRILELRPGASESPIICTLKPVLLNDNPYYETLSYVWGSSTQRKSIIVGGAMFNVTDNLFDFLRCLRKQTTPRYIWADAICIDQLNEDEKEKQIALMTRVYRQAKENHIWFGRFTDSW